MFAYKPKDFLKASKPCSGRLFGSVHFGPPIAPNKIASAFWHASSVSAVKGT